MTALGTLGRRPAEGRLGPDASRDQAHRDACRELLERREAAEYARRWQYQERSDLGKLRLTPDRSIFADLDVWGIRERLGMRELPEGLATAQEVSWSALRVGALSRMAKAETQKPRAWALRDLARHAHPVHRCAGCGWDRIGTVGVVERPAGGWAVASVATCGSVWMCPVCALAIKAERAAEIVRGVALHRMHFGAQSLAMVTHTIRHQAGADLAKTAEGFQAAWNRYKTRVPTRTKRIRRLLRKWNSSSHYPTASERLGAIGGVYGAEVTHGRHGWHYHRHELLAFDRNVTALELERYHAEQAAWWIECVTREMGPEFAPTMDRGLRVDPLNVANYIAKLGLEVSDVGVKKAKGGNVTPWGLLAAAAQNDRRALTIFADYAAAMRGKKAVQFSEKLIEKWEALGWERALESDEELADDARGGRLVLEVPAPAWAEIRRSGQLVQALEAPDLEGLTTALYEIAPRRFWEPEGDWGNGERVQLEKDAFVDAREALAVQLEGGGKKSETQAALRARLAFVRGAYKAALAMTSR